MDGANDEQDAQSGTLGFGEEIKGIAVTGEDVLGETALCCPVCGFFSCHVGQPLYVPRDEGWGRREGYLGIPVDGECGHRWVITFRQHKGQEFVTTERVYDAPGPRVGR